MRAIGRIAVRVRLLARKLTLRGRGSMVGGTANDMPPPPTVGREQSIPPNHFF
jgi:hypothetical protein